MPSFRDSMAWDLEHANDKIDMLTERAYELKDTIDDLRYDLRLAHYLLDIERKEEAREL